jgi:hypothetical protein
MRKLREKNERMNKFLYKSIFALLVLELLFILVSEYILPHHNFLQATLLKYEITLRLGTIGTMFLFCSLLLLAFLTSRISPLKSVQLRYQLLNFKQEFLTSGVELYHKQTDCLKIELFCNGFVDDEVKLGKQFSQYLRLNLLHFEAQNAADPTLFILGEQASRQNGMEELLNE